MSLPKSAGDIGAGAPQLPKTRFDLRFGRSGVYFFVEPINYLGRSGLGSSDTDPAACLVSWKRFSDNRHMLSFACCRWRRLAATKWSITSGVSVGSRGGTSASRGTLRPRRRGRHSSRPPARTGANCYRRRSPRGHQPRHGARIVSMVLALLKVSPLPPRFAEFGDTFHIGPAATKSAPPGRPRYPQPYPESVSGRLQVEPAQPDKTLIFVA
jgi:hypothetical protein